MKTVIKIFNELASTNSPNEKEEIIRRNLDNELFDKCIRFYLDDLIITGIARKKLNKALKDFKSNTPTNMDLVELLDYIKKNNTGKDEDIRVGIKVAQQYDKDVEDMIYSLVCKDLKIGTGISTYNKANPSNPIYIHDVMAGKAYDEERALKLIKKGCKLYTTRKIDGNRGSRNVETTAFISRNGKVWEGTESILEEANSLMNEYYRLDGEFEYNDITGKMTSQEVRAMTSSIMGDSSIKDKGEAGIVFNIFEIVKREDWNSTDKGETYEQRRARMDELIQDVDIQNAKYIRIIPTEFIVTNEEELSQVIPKLKKFIEMGNEGYMMISSDQVYKTGKGYQMMKLKNVISADLKIVGWNYGKEKTKWEGKFASFTVEFPYIDKNGVKGIYNVNVGTGYADDFRLKVNENPDMYIGKILECLVTEISKNKEGGYSFSYARFVDIREDKDTIDLEGHTLVEIDGEMYFKADREVEDSEE